MLSSKEKDLLVNEYNEKIVAAVKSAEEGGTVNFLDLYASIDYLIYRLKF